MAQTYYDILGVSESASRAEIQDAYRSLSFLLHPDRHPNAPQHVVDTAVSKMVLINEAYTCLSDSTRRSEYDQSLSDVPTRRPTPRTSSSPPPRAVAAIIRAVDNDLQGRYKIARKRFQPHHALLSSLRSGMNPQDYIAVERFFRGQGTKEAAQHGQRIHGRLVRALETANAKDLAAATAPWG
jgi:curved DNA-binding protein CbpA